MLNAIIRFSLHYRLLIVVVSLIVLVYGNFVTTTLPIDVFPDLDRPRVVVMTEAPGLAPEEVETLVTFPLESVLLGANGVIAVRSQSAPGVSVVLVEFDWGSNIYLARQTVQERLSEVSGSMPPGIKPQLAPISSIMGQIIHVGLVRRCGPSGGELSSINGTRYLAEWAGTSVRVWDPVVRNDPSRWQPVPATAPAPGDDRRTEITLDGRRYSVYFLPPDQQQMALRTTADWVLRPRLLKISGIAQAVPLGSGRKQYHVLVNPAALLEYDVTLHQVEDAVRKNNTTASGGFAIAGERERPIRILGRLGPDAEQVLRDLRELPVKVTPHRSIQLGQVARVVEAPQQPRGSASVNGQPATVMIVTKQPHADTRTVTDQIKAAMVDAEATLPADIEIDLELFQLKRFIDTGIYNVGEALVIGAILVLIILFLFLLNFRTTFISLTAIPLSLAITALVFKLIGSLTGATLSINVMTLGGIAVAMGELVDDAVVDVENIFRRLKENNARAEPRPIATVIYQASVEVRGAIVFGTIMVILVFLPLFALSGVEGRLFSPLGVAYIVSILASLLVSLTVTPVLSYYLLPSSQASHRAHDSPLLRILKRGALYLIRLSLARPATLLLFGWLLVGGAVVVMLQLGADFLPPFDEGSVQVNVTLPPGSSLDASDRTSKLVDATLNTFRVTADNPTAPVLRFARRTGRAELDEHAEPVTNTEYIVAINPASGRRRDDIIREIRETLEDQALGADIEVEQPLQHLISHMLSGVTAQIAIKVYGDDLDVLRRTAEQIKGAVRDLPGITTPVIESQRLSDELHLRLRPEQLAFYGLDRESVAEFLSTALRGEEVSQILEGQRRFDLVVRLDTPYRDDFASLSRLQLELPDGRGKVALGELVTIEDGAGPNLINRENARRRIVLRINVQDRDLAGAVADIRAQVNEQVRMPEGYNIEFGGQFESQTRATRMIGVLAAVSGLGMFVVLFMLFPSWRIVLQILNALPIAFVGGVAALAITGQTLTVASLVGFISLGGIATRNGILLVSHYFHLMRHEDEGFTEAMILRGSLERLAPVLMTALTAGIALVPLVVVGHAPGREILYPVATVILGGLVTSTVAEYLIHPGLFRRFSGSDALRLQRERDAETDAPYDDDDQ